MTEKLFFANPSAQTAHHRDAIDAAIAGALDGSMYIQGPAHDGFERALAAYVGVAHTVGVGNGTDAILLALKAFDIGPGDEVVVPSHTATASISAIRQAGAEPVFADVDEQTYVTSVSHVAAAVGPRTRAVLGVHLYGCMLDADAMRAFCDERALIFVEDCAQATGASWRGRRAGSFGHAATFSFFPTKNLAAIGDGGAVATNDAAVAERVRRLRTYGWSPDRIALEDGYNSRLDELQAAILAVKLPHLDAENARRAEIAARYSGHLADVPVQRPVCPDEVIHVYHLYVVALDARDALQHHLMSHGIVAGIHYPVPNHEHGAFASARRAPLRNTERLVRRILTLPMYPELPDDAVDRVCSAIRQFFQRRSSSAA